MVQHNPFFSARRLARSICCLLLPKAVSHMVGVAFTLWARENGAVSFAFAQLPAPIPYLSVVEYNCSILPFSVAAFSRCRLFFYVRCLPQTEYTA